MRSTVRAHFVCADIRSVPLRRNRHRHPPRRVALPRLSRTGTFVAARMRRNEGRWQDCCCAWPMIVDTALPIYGRDRSIPHDAPGPAHRSIPLPAARRLDQALEAQGFHVTATPMSAGTPFANVLLCARYDAERGNEASPALRVHDDELPGSRSRTHARCFSRGIERACSVPVRDRRSEHRVGEIPGLDDVALPPRPRALRLPEQPRLRSGSRAGRIPREGRGSGAALRPPPCRRVHRHQHGRHPADRARLSTPRSGERRIASRLRLSPHAQYVLGCRVCADAARIAGPVRGGVHGVLVERQGLRHRIPHARGGPDRHRGRRRRRYALPHDALRIRLAATALRAALPTLRRRPRRHLDRRGGGVLPARACDSRRIDRAARRRGIERCASHVGAASRRTGRAAGDGSRTRGRRDSPPKRSTT